MKLTISKNELKPAIKALAKLKSPTEQPVLLLTVQATDSLVSLGVDADGVNATYYFDDLEVSEPGSFTCDIREFEAALKWRKNVLLSLRFTSSQAYLIDEDGVVEDVAAQPAELTLERSLLNSCGVLTCEDWLVSLKELVKTTNTKSPISALDAVYFNTKEQSLALWSVDGASITEKTLHDIHLSDPVQLACTKAQAESVIRVLNESKEKHLSLDFQETSLTLSGQTLMVTLSMRQGLNLPVFQLNPSLNPYAFKRQAVLDGATTWRKEAKDVGVSLNEVWISSVTTAEQWFYEVQLLPKFSRELIKGPTVNFNQLYNVVKDSLTEDWVAYVPNENSPAFGISYTKAQMHFVRWFMPLHPGLEVEDEGTDSTTMSASPSVI